MARDLLAGGGTQPRDLLADASEAPSDVWQGVKSGAANLGKSVARAVEGVASATGAQGVKEAAGRVAESLGDSANRNAPRVGLVEDIHSLGDAADWAQGVGTSSAVQMAPALASSAAGARLGFRLGGARGAVLGSAVGAFAPNLVQQFGELYDEQRQVGADDPGRAAAYALPAAALDSVLPGKVAGRVVAPVAKEIVEGVAKRGLKGAVKGAFTEGATEMAQEELAILNRVDVDPTYDRFGEEANSRRLNSGAGGALFGGPLGGIGGVAERGPRQAPLPPVEAPKPTTNLSQQLDQQFNIKKPDSADHKRRQSDIVSAFNQPVTDFADKPVMIVGEGQVERPMLAIDQMERLAEARQREGRSGAAVATPGQGGALEFERVAPPQQDLELAQPGAEPAPDGIDFERQIDTSGMALDDGSAAQPVTMPAPDIDTSRLALDPMNPLVAPATPRGPLSRAAAMAPQQRVLEGEWLGPENAVTPAQPIAGAVESPVIEGELGQPRAFARPAISSDEGAQQTTPSREVAALPAPSALERMDAAAGTVEGEGMAPIVPASPRAMVEESPPSPAVESDSPPEIAPPSAGQIVSGPLASAYRNDKGAVRIKGDVGQLRAALAERGIKGGLYDRANGELVFPPGSRMANDPDAVAKIRGEMPAQPDHLATAYRTENGGVRIKGPVQEVRAALSARGIPGGLYDRANGELVFPPGSKVANDPQALARIRGEVAAPASPASPAPVAMAQVQNPAGLSLVREGGVYVARDANGAEVARHQQLIPFAGQVRSFEESQGVARGAGIRILPGQIPERPTGQAEPAQPTKTDPVAIPSGTSAQYSRRGQRPNDFVLREGSEDWGRIPEEVEQRTKGQFPAAPIRLTNGRHIAKGRGYGLVHIAESHQKELQQMGMTAEQYVDSILGRVTDVYDPGNGRLILRARGLPAGSAFLELRNDGDFYSVVTAFDANREGKLVWSGRARELAQRGPGPSDRSDATTTQSSANRSAEPLSGLEREAPKLNPPLDGRFADQTRTDSVPPVDADGNAEGQPYRRAAGSIGGMPVSTVERMLIARTAGWENAPDVAVVQGIGDLPPHLREQVERDGATDVEGIYDNGRVYLVADNLRSPKHAAFTLLHEVMGHHGLRGVFGRKLNPLLNSLYHSHPELRADADALIERYGYDRALAVEEVLADLAASGDIQHQAFWPRLVQAFKNWLRQVGFDLGWSDADIQGLLASARRYVEGRTAPAGTGAAPTAAPAYSRTGQRAAELYDRATGRGDAPMPADLTAGQRDALKKIGTYRGKESITETASRLTDRWKLKLVQGIFDQFRPLKDLDETAYMQARLSKGTDGTLESVFRFGPPKFTDGALDVQRDGKGLQGILAELAGDHDRFFAWMAGNRAKQLKVEGRERLFSDQDIAELTTLNQGKLPDGRSRAGAFANAAAQFRAYQKAVLDVATQAGLIDGNSRAQWESEFYVPFYRVMEEDGTGTAGPGQIGGIVGQRAFQKLKGGKEPLGDLLANTLSNWSHLLSASMKNLAAQRALAAAEKAGVATQVASAEKGTVRVMTQGKERHYQVHDPLVLDALTMLHHQGWNNPAMKAMRTMKHWLTTGVTVSPTFRVRNLIRDMVSAIAVNDMGYNPLGNVIKGWTATGEGSNTLARLIAGGGAVRFGALNDGDQAAYAKRLIDSGVKANQILDGPAKVKAFFRKGWDWYQEMGDRMETINRAALYEKALADGKSHLEASFAARDMMDFTSAGKWASIRFLTQIVPFMNARLQGMYKLGRGAKEHPLRASTMAGAVALVSAAFYLWNKDDEDYQQLPDWVRNTYWWVKVGGQAYYIPKPFELGALGTVVERGTELTMAGDDYQARDFARTVWGLLVDQLAMNPTPQLVKPAMEAMFNRDSFRDRAIDTQGQMRLPAEDRYTAHTSAGAIAASRVINAVPLADKLELSPQRIEHLARGYFGWMGTQALNAADWLGRPLMDLPGKPAMRISDMFMVGDFVKDADANSGKYLGRFYEQQKQVDQLYAAFNLARTTGDLERAQELAGDNRLRQRAVFNAIGRQITELNRRIKAVSNDRLMDGEERRTLLDTLNGQRERLARMADERAREMV
ncbi:LPD38 domain-containing protein [Chitiniphilus shinanonensis]|uniref:LPD38 domain-containing protein n=1 Tax=Chitiniphilus shinanonensis TaxID=553088 RepID=UPI003048E74D